VFQKFRVTHTQNQAVRSIKENDFRTFSLRAKTRRTDFLVFARARKRAGRIFSFSRKREKAPDGFFRFRACAKTSPAVSPVSALGLKP
jgi:hypothetical protein